MPPKPAARATSEANRILNCIPSPRTEMDWGLENAQGAGLFGFEAAIPAAKDLREAWWTIANQGGTGACVGWAATDSVIRWHFVKAGRITKDELLSPRFVWMAAKETDAFSSQPTTFIETDGTSLKAALDIARKYGSVRDPILPFGSGKLYAGNVKTFYALAAQLKITSYFNLGTNPGSWRRWLATKGPILTRLEVDSAWNSASATKGNLDAYNPATARGGHAVALVGYTADRFIVRNSWGTGWGDQGFAYASADYARQAFKEAYGVSV